jgi:TRAP-type C4-dicarboxylate transport system permease small subunit
VDTIWRMVERVLGLVALLALFSLVLLPATQVFMRDFFSAPIIGLEEGTRWGLIILVFCGAPLLIAANEQIRLAEFIDYLPRHLRIGLERGILFFSGLSIACIAYAGLLSILRSPGTRTSVLDIPFWLFASPMLIGFSAAALGYLYFALRRQDPPIGGAPGMF